LPKILISCGEPSGDLYAGALAKEILQLDPHSEIFGLGGERFRDGGGRLLDDYHGLSVTGLIEALRVLPRSLAAYRRLIAVAESERPDVFVAIDFPDFNFRVARRVKRLGIPVVYYIPPQLWAWRQGRIRDIQQFATRVIVIFPFEEELYRRSGIPVQFVGHPLVDLARATVTPDAFRREFHLEPTAPLVALLPGSRPNEVSRILPVLLQSAARVATVVPRAQFVIARAPHLEDRLFADLGAVGNEFSRVVTDRTDDVLAAADVVATASGTATVQTAIHGAPMVVVYRLSPITYALGRRFVQVSTYAMVNLIAGKKVVPELIQDDCNPEQVAAEIVRYLTDSAYVERVRASLADVRDRLGRGGASERAADAILELALNRNGRSRSPETRN
jgi:lipid-A-disaccharide synthase